MGHSTAADGTGFCLSIVKQVANAHGWEISLTTSPTGGMQVEFSDI